MIDFLGALSGRQLLSPQQVAQVRALAADARETPVRVLLRQNLVDQQTLAGEIVRCFSHPMATVWPEKHILQEAISPRFMRERHVLPESDNGTVLTVIVSDPTDSKTLNALRLAAGRDLSLRIATDDQILAAIDRLNQSVEVTSDDRLLESLAEDDEILKDLALDAPVIELLNRMFREVSSARATDLHIEPSRNNTIIRRRVDGRLSEVERLPRELGRAAVSRLKILTNLNIAERRLPQDGRARLRIGDREHDIRVATMPTIHGESIAIRFLSANTQAPELSRIGMSEEDLKRFCRELGHAHGMVVVTGPTGSGKTTTLAGAVGFLNDPARKIVTIEDPVEYQIAGVNQIQVHSEIGLTFARTLRSLLRFDPDVMMIGEMRDGETASIGVNAALTGHLVLTTLHTNTAAGAIVRLLDLGVQAYLIASTLRCVVGQRLVRKLCFHCREPYEPTPELLAQLPAIVVAQPMQPARFWRAKGCSYCGGSGYNGRAAIFELLTVDEELRRLIKPDISAQEVAASALRAGFTTMLTDGLRKCCEGLTTIEEVGRVTSET